MPHAWYDGKLVDKNDIKISPVDLGFARGMTMFEFTRVYGGVAFHLDYHIQRFLRGAKTLGIPFSMSESELTQAANQVIAKNNFAHSGLKFYLTIGESGSAKGIGFSSNADFTPHMMMIEEELHPDRAEAPKGLPLYQRGAGLKTVPFIRQIPEAKTINYAAGFLASRQLDPNKHEEILYLHNNGYVTETTTSNFFCVIDGKLLTPKQNMLEGVTRIIMLRLAKQLNIPAAEADITLADLQRASEAFITGTFLEMMPVRMIDDIAYKTTMDAPVFAKLRAAFTNYVADYCRQAKAA